jgi:hypothetical protein
MDINEEISIDFFKNDDKIIGEVYCLGGFFMNEKVLIGIICGLVLVVFGIGSYVMMTPTINPDPIDPAVESVFEENQLPKYLGVERPDTKVPRLFAIRNYDDMLDQEEINSIACLRYYVLDNRAKDHMLIIPFDIGGRITVTRLEWDPYEEDYLPSNREDAVLIDEQIVQGYSLLLQYDRPSNNPEYQIKITQGSSTATYKIGPATNELEEYEFVKRD